MAAAQTMMWRDSAEEDGSIFGPASIRVLSARTTGEMKSTLVSLLCGKFWYWDSNDDSDDYIL